MRSLRLILILMTIGLCSISLNNFAKSIINGDTTISFPNGEELKCIGDSTYIYYPNRCLKHKGIWSEQLKKWTGTHYKYFENPCGIISHKFINDEYGNLLDVKIYDELGQQIIEDPLVRNIISLFPTKATKINGFCFTLSHNKPRIINGLNIEFPGSRFTEYIIYRLSRDIYPGRFSTVNGLTISFNPIYEKVNGVGIFAFVTEIYEFNGLIIGPFNGVKEMNGLQLGLFNRAASGKLIQIGLLNTISSNPKWLRTLPLLNMHFKKSRK